MVHPEVLQKFSLLQLFLNLHFAAVPEAERRGCASSECLGALTTPPGVRPSNGHARHSRAAAQELQKVVAS